MDLDILNQNLEYMDTDILGWNVEYMIILGQNV